MHFTIFYIYNVCERKRERRKSESASLKMKMHFACTFPQKDALTRSKMHSQECKKVHAKNKSALFSAPKVHFQIVNENAQFIDNESNYQPANVNSASLSAFQRKIPPSPPRAFTYPVHFSGLF